MILTAVTPDAIAQAADLLRQGKLVAMPTETVYGLAADAANPQAVAKIFAAKGRPADHPLIVHLAEAKQMQDWAIQIPAAAWQLAAAFWPGPLTMVLPKQTHVSMAVTGGQQTVALRVPAHPVALAVLQAFGGGVAAPSANRFGRISPTLPQHVAEELSGVVDCILDGGACTVGVESTIIDLTDAQPTILRPGRITRSQLQAVLQCEIALKSQHKIRAPGMLAAHYAPQTPAYLCEADALATLCHEYAQNGRSVGILAFSGQSSAWPAQQVRCLPQAVADYEAALYAALRELDALSLAAILVERPPATEAWMAVLDRLSKATV